MPKITGGFSTKNKDEMMRQLNDAGAGMRLPFVAESGIQVTKNPLEGFDVKDAEDNSQKISVYVRR